MNKFVRLSFLVVILAAISYLFVDRDVAYFFRYSPQVLKDFFEIVTEIGDSKYSLIISFLLFLYFRFKQNSLFAARAIFIWLSVALSGVLADILKIVFARPRPKFLFSENLYGFDFFRLGSSWSFPSGHSSTAFSLSLALIFLFPKYKKVLLFTAIMVAFSRVVVCAHFVSDVLIGGLVGIIVTLILERYFANHKCFNIYQNGCKLKP